MFWVGSEPLKKNQTPERNLLDAYNCPFSLVEKCGRLPYVSYRTDRERSGACTFVFFLFHRIRCCRQLTIWLLNAFSMWFLILLVQNTTSITVFRRACRKFMNDFILHFNEGFDDGLEGSKLLVIGLPFFKSCFNIYCFFVSSPDLD